jgi:hypothetical protein
MHIGRPCVWLSVVALTSVTAAVGKAFAANELTEMQLQELVKRYHQLSEDERVAISKPIKAALQRLRTKPKPAAQAAPAKELSNETTPSIVPPAEKINQWQTTVLVRDSFTPIAYITVPTTKAEDLPVDGALFSYTYNNVSRTDTFLAKGAVMVARHAETDYQLYDGYLAPRISYVNFAPGVEFDTTLRNGKNFGSFSGIAGLELETTHYDNPFMLQYWRANAVYTTDRDASAQIFGFEGTWQPWAPTLLIGTSIPIYQPLGMWFGFYPTLNADFYEVAKAGIFTDLDRKQYMWMGPKVAANLFFDSGPLQPFSATVKYFYLYEALGGGTANVSYFQGSLKYRFTKELSVEGRYTNGTTPRTLEKRDEFYVGFTLLVGELR